MSTGECLHNNQLPVCVWLPGIWLVPICMEQFYGYTHGIVDKDQTDGIYYTIIHVSLSWSLQCCTFKRTCTVGL